MKKLRTEDSDPLVSKVPKIIPEAERKPVNNVCVKSIFPNIIRVIRSRRLRWAGQVARMGERRGAYRALVGKPERRRPLGRPRRRWEDNIKMDLREVGCGAQTGLIWLRIGRGGGLLCDEPSGSIKCGEFVE
jgi:hypothetical protein